MPDDLKSQISSLWGGFRKKAAETVANTEASFALGKVAAKAVTDDNGNIIVEAGHTIDERVVEHARVTGKLHALAAAVATAGAQDLREKARSAYHGTEDGREAHALSQVDDFVEARGYLGWTAGVDVTTAKGELVIRAGKEIQESDVQAAREFGLLRALIYSAQQPLPEGFKKDTTDTRPVAYTPPPPAGPRIHAPKPQTTLPDLSQLGGEDS